jgi:hypothetical protein
MERQHLTVVTNQSDRLIGYVLAEGEIFGLADRFRKLAQVYQASLL